MLDAHAHVMQVKLCKANTRGVTTVVLQQDAQIHRLEDPTAKSSPAWLEQSR